MFIPRAPRGPRSPPTQLLQPRAALRRRFAQRHGGGTEAAAQDGRHQGVQVQGAVRIESFLGKKNMGFLGWDSLGWGTMDFCFAMESLKVGILTGLQ